MKNKHFLIAFTLLCSIVSLANGQSFEYGVGFHGTTVIEVDQDQQPVNDELGLNTAIGFMVAGNFPIFNFSNELSVNSYTQVQAGIFTNIDVNAFEPLLFAHIPTFISLNYGASSSKKSVAPFGIGAGLGYSFTGYLGSVDPSYQDSELFLSYFAPVVMVEIAFDFGRSDNYFDNAKLCLEKNLTKTYFQYTDESTNSTVEESFSQFNLSLIFFKDHQ